MVQNVWEKIAENLGFVGNSNFIRGSTKQLSVDVLIQKQPSTGVLIKRHSENLQKIYRRHPCRSAISIKLLKSHFAMGILLYICCIFSGHLFLKTPLENFFCWYKSAIEYPWGSPIIIMLQDLTQDFGIKLLNLKRLVRCCFPGVRDFSHYFWQGKTPA